MILGYISVQRNDSFYLIWMLILLQHDRNFLQKNYSEKNE